VLLSGRVIQPLEKEQLLTISTGVSMKIEIEEKTNGVVIKLKGNITGIPDASEFNNSINRLLDENKNNIVIDFGNISYVDSTGLGIILRGYKTVKNAGGDIKIASLNERMSSLLEITKLNTIIDLYDNADTALSNFN
jgi:anti-sigma B factor antagonist